MRKSYCQGVEQVEDICKWSSLRYFVIDLQIGRVVWRQIERSAAKDDPADVIGQNANKYKRWILDRYLLYVFSLQTSLAA